jgi:hypothetical protein
MPTTATTAFNLDITDLVEEAYERAGLEVRSGYDMRTARRSLNLLTIEWANRGINLWTVEQGSIPLLTNVGTYNLPVDTIDLLGGATSPTGVVYPTITVYPLPSNDSYTLQYWRLRRIKDAGNGVETVDIPFRFLPALVAGLAYYVSVKRPESTDRVQMLKLMYDESFQMAIDEDREKASIRAVPRQMFIG